MKKREIIMVSSVSFSVGVILGILMSPVKGGFGNNISKTTNNYYVKNFSEYKHTTSFDKNL